MHLHGFKFKAFRLPPSAGISTYRFLGQDECMAETFKSRKPPSPAKLQKQCDDWNAKWPIGTYTEYHPVIGAPGFRVRKTLTRAQVLSGHTAVVWLEDERGCVALDACIPLRTANAQPTAQETTPEAKES